MKHHRYRWLTVMLLFFVLWITSIRGTMSAQNETGEMEAKGRISFEFPWRIDAKVEVNLTPQLLHLASKSLGNTAETSALIRMLDGIYVRTYDRTAVDVEELVNYFRWKLKVNAWETVVSIKGENETLEINLLFDEDKIYGVFASVIPKTPEEIIFVNIFGEIAPGRIETLLRSLDNFGVMAIDVRHKLRMLAVSTRRTGQRQLLAVKVDYPPTIDGVLDDTSWKIAPHADGFTHGYYEDPVADDSVVKVVYTRQAIYVGWHLYDSQPDKIVASRTETDTSFKAGEDYVHFMIDPFHTHEAQDSINFMANPYGVKLIEIIQAHLGFTDAERLNQYNVAAKIVENGWIVEMEIPWKILDYPETTEPIRMGLNFGRVHARTRTASVWSNAGFPIYRSEDDGHWLHVLPPPKWPDTQIPRVISDTKPHEHLHQKGDTP